MAQEETITILRVGTDEAVKSVGDLKANIVELKGKLNDLEVGTEEYQSTLSELKVNQNAMRDAMYATSGSMEDVAKAAKGTGESYNALVHQMAKLKEEFRATEDAARRHDLGEQIDKINTKLKELDALQGNFQRNVGNYQSVFKGFAEKTDAFGKGLKFAKGGINDFKDASEGLAKSPAIATFAILLSAVMKIADKMKENETVMASVKKAMESMKPVMDFIAGIVDKLATYLADIIGKVAEFLGNSGLFAKIIDGAVGVGNAVMNFIIAPFKGIVKAIGVLKEQGVKGLKDAAKAFGEEMKNGVAFKSNFEAGQAAADAVMSGVKSKQPEIDATATAVGEQAGESIAEGIRKGFDKALAEANKKFDEELKQRQAEQKEIEDMTNAMLDETNAEIDAYFEEQARMREADLKDAEAKAQAKVALMQNVASSTSSILGSIADIYEADEKANEKNAKKVKALRIMSAVIDTISGAVGAFTQAVKTYAPPYGAIIGGVQAAAVSAAGAANVAKMKSTDVGSTSTTAATMSAPVVTANMNSVRNITSASEEDRLNRIASDQRVYILSSDIQASQNQIKTQVAESSF